MGCCLLEVYDETKGQEKREKGLDWTQYSQYDGGPNAEDKPRNVPPSELNNIMILYYSTYVKVTEVSAVKFQLIQLKSTMA